MMNKIERGKENYDQISENTLNGGRNARNCTNLGENVNENFQFSIDINDTIFVLTRNNSNYIEKEGITNLITKMVIVKELNFVALNELGKYLNFINVEKLNIFCINNKLDDETYYYFRQNEISDVRYAELNLEKFKKFINSDKNFLDYNKYSLYILRNGNFLDLKNIFATVNGTQFNIGIVGSQKAHVLSPLDLRLSSYLLAMFGFNYKEISKLNYFNQMSKDRYLSYKDI
jgi:hypothetical protein